jgi:hypothetical protein
LATDEPVDEQEATHRFNLSERASWSVNRQ